MLKVRKFAEALNDVFICAVQTQHNERVKKELTDCMAMAENSLSVFESRYNQEKKEKEFLQESLIKREQEVAFFESFLK